MFSPFIMIQKTFVIPRRLPLPGLMLDTRHLSTTTAPPKPPMATLASTKELHAHLVRTYLHKDPSSISDVLRFYALSPPHLNKACFVFNHIKRPTLMIWNLMIRGLSQSEKPSEAIQMYSRMSQEGLVGNNLTFIFIFKACARVSDIVCGQKAQACALKLGFESYLYVSNALIHMYSSCGDLGCARKVFDEMLVRDVVSWNSLICGYSQCNRYNEVLAIFEAMRVTQNVRADAVTMVKVVLACIHLGEWEIADRMVKYVDETGVGVDVYLGNTLIDMYGRRCSPLLAQEVFDRMRERNVVSWNAMINGYAKVGRLVDARKFFDRMTNKDVISWTSMITGYSQANQHAEAVSLFREMMAANVRPDKVTVASVLSACAHVGSLDVGEALHKYIRKHGVKTDVYVGNALIDMYCKCGVAEKALAVFQGMDKKDSVSWTSVISGLAVNGFADSAHEFFSEMLTEGIRPTHGTFVGILLACAHAGLVDKGLEYFESMGKIHGLMPEMKHYGCVVDLLSRAGKLQEAYEFMQNMPVVPDVVVWRILLGACQVHGNLALGEIVSHKLIELDPSNSGNYILSSNNYASSHRWDCVAKMRGLMDESNVQKPFGSSSIEINGALSNNLSNTS
ncbi:pentatricopeptide repeat-containing protein At2g22410, mitochondrial [Argentina anserina]|uniref:pentatricopeptide repeat-containing protein At2g22410, mitochondrial n=1 Tax=Argentina anserina TaxID=57926 RepID=UPI00217669EF|nr:pentatricopeptide repeat-containing protein At2g22410, mitochondrial [Potentilla anserina]XP_050365199.1 pentatricopeptide repeat-containing protein At2g22410, mitochondrial [Potentilla anserina]XP_050365200.1 pentatricopeptide repeat-containing protein At2g22410, mitochondrial [Potentilla anserina]